MKQLSSLAGVSALAGLGVFTLLGIASCLFPHEDPSRGELGVAEFAWNQGMLGCLLGCDASEPVADGASNNLFVANADELPTFDVSSSDPLIALFMYDPESSLSSVRVDTLAPGRVKVILTEADSDALIDRFEIDVQSVDQIALSNPKLYQNRLMVMKGGEVQVEMALYAPDRRRLAGIGGLEYTLSGAITEEQVTLGSALADAFRSLLMGSQEYLRLEALSPGMGTVTATARSGVELSIPIAVVDATMVTEVTLDVVEGPTVEDGALIHADAFNDAEPIYSPACDWELSPPTGPISIYYTDRSSIRLKASAPGTTTVTCVVGTTSQSAQLSFQ